VSETEQAELDELKQELKDQIKGNMREKPDPVLAASQFTSRRKT
jgi:hypothetical protein